MPELDTTLPTPEWLRPQESSTPAFLAGVRVAQEDKQLAIEREKLRMQQRHEQLRIQQDQALIPLKLQQLALHNQMYVNQIQGEVLSNQLKSQSLKDIAEDQTAFTDWAKTTGGTTEGILNTPRPSFKTPAIQRVADSRWSNAANSVAGKAIQSAQEGFLLKLPKLGASDLLEVNAMMKASGGEVTPEIATRIDSDLVKAAKIEADIKAVEETHFGVPGVRNPKTGVWKEVGISDTKSIAFDDKEEFKARLRAISQDVSLNQSQKDAAITRLRNERDDARAGLKPESMTVEQETIKSEIATIDADISKKKIEIAKDPSKMWFGREDKRLEPLRELEEKRKRVAGQLSTNSPAAAPTPDSSFGKFVEGAIIKNKAGKKFVVKNGIPVPVNE